jgi:hypothetical protein
MGRSRSLDKETSRASWRRTRGTLVLVAGLVVGAAILIPGGSAASSGFSAVFTPPTVTGGAATTINLTITNEGGPQLVSADVSAPPGFTITGAPSPMPGGSNWSATGVQLRHLNLSTGNSFSVAIPAASACTPGSYPWTITAQSNSGALTLDGPNSAVTTAVSGTNCKFEFVTQPKDAQVNATITGSTFNPSGTPVTVAVRNLAANALDPTATGSVSLTASKNDTFFTGNGKSPELAVALVGGQATFPSLKSSTTGQFITLTASGSFVSSNASNLFNILAQVVPCTTTCKGQQAQGATTVDASASGFASGDVLAVTVYPAADFSPPPNCGGAAGSWTPLAGASGAQVEYIPQGQGWTVTITMRIDKSLIPTSKGASQYDVCLGAKRVAQTSCLDAPGFAAGFQTKSGANAVCDAPSPGTPLSSPPTLLYWGLLPNCPNGNKPIPGPCVQSKNKNNAGDLILVIVKPDPWDGNAHT